ncbi:MAG: hypothetical protein PWP46_1065 [Fusobacteriaceae bacterium]|jgi:sigma-E factor negative regulatory protein RseC|nr:positive regulator of sigma RseC/MucC [Fusobacteriales bacterium]MDN5304183.1 hypothetical protein [Fusobacteriaceae bacterium]
MKNKGLITKINGNEIKVYLFKDSACSHCSGCSDSDKMSCEYTFKTDTTGLKEGDIIDFEMNNNSLLKLGLIVYILPIFLLFFMYYIGSLIKLSQGANILFSFLGLIIYFIILFVIEKVYGKNFLKQNIKISKGD